MKRSTAWLLGLVVACVLVSNSFAAEIPAKDRIVILVTVDGFPFWIWKDPSLAMPTLRKIAAEGAVGSMKVVNPSITWPNHTTLVTGVTPAKHGVMFNGLLTRGAPGKPFKLEQWRDKKDMVRTPTVYDAAFKAGLTTAHVDWPATQNSGTFTWEFTELSDPNGKVEKAMVAAGYMTQLDLDEYKKRNSVYRDELWTRAGEFLIEKHRPNFLLFHLLTTDSINHKYGPGSLPSFTAYAFTDACLKRLINTLEASGMKDKYTLLITTDHGFKSATKLIRSDAVLRKEELMKRNGAVVLSCDAISKSYGGGSAIYITDPAKKATLVPKLKEIFSKIEGVEKVYDASEYAEIGLAQPTDNEQVGDLFMVAKDGYAFTDAFTEGDIVVDQKLEGTSYAGHHGYFNADPQLNGTFIAYGYGIKKGVKLEDFSNLSVAPTIAKLLGIELPDADGKPLESALDLK